MRNLCTVSDESFIVKGYTLYESLAAKSKDFVLHYLCIDAVSFLRGENKDNIKFYLVDDLIKNDPIMQELKKTNYKYFCWSLASYFSNWLLQQGNIDGITYIDSDIYFHEDINFIFNEIGEKEIGLFRHRQFSLSENRNEGWFNVGVVYFKGSNFGKSCLKWWAESVKNRLYPNLATCGDQKYLDAFIYDLTKDLIFVDGNIGHGAPWHWQIYDLSQWVDRDVIVWNGKEQKLVFTHFSQFVPNYKENTYIPSSQHHCYTPLNMYEENINLKYIYDEYFNKLKTVMSKYNLP